MDVMTLMAQFADPETLKNLSITQKLTASMITTFLGMGITFTSLIILQVVIGLLARFTTEKAVEKAPQSPANAVSIAAAEEDQRHRDEELVAAITVALSLQLGTGVGNIVIRNIRKIEDHSPAWNKVGLAELMNNNA
ncbi:OadG family protein [Desulfopila aestuarii]|uniref:Sodium pump decarboxylases, gamma subunit n=1 Tax=Desulfopila aestuarii DSM 18488 TaxID=1121416 RepID=A0A1M7YF04_9BACT|nr:OadG family protein [Desulfopila aestuarii]SHO51193.1 sodium pump decarboxylases, gamma subunit [Desulfopila aestuarii DSM 18488]